MEVIKLASYLMVNNDKLIILMAKNNLTVKELCKKANVFDGTLRNIKKTHNARPTTVYKLAKALNVEVEDLIEEN